MKDKQNTRFAGVSSDGSLSIRLFVSILLFSSLITLVLTATQAYLDFKRDLSNVEILLQQVGGAHSGAIANSLWTLDKEDASVIAQGMLSIPNIIFIEVSEGNNIWLQSGIQPVDNFIDARYPLDDPINSTPSSPVTIGSLAIYATLDTLYDGLYDRTTTLLITNGIKTLLVAGFILVFVNWLITRHLRRVSLHLSDLDTEDHTELKITRGFPLTESNDEIDVLVAGINDMRGDLLRSLEEQKKVEDEFRTLSAWQRAALDAADYSVISTDKDGVIATFNKKAEQMLQYTAGEMIGKHTPATIHDKDEVIAYARVLSEQLQEDIKPGFEVFVRHARDGIIDEREWTYIRKDGTTVPVLLSVTAIRSETDEIIGFLGIATDLTQHQAIVADLEKSEALYQNLFANAGDAIVLLEPTGELVDCNPAALELFGYSRDNFIGQNIVRFSPEKQAHGEDSGVYADRLLAQAMHREQQVFEWVHQKSDGSIFEVEVSLSKIEIDQQTFLQAILRDITKRKELENSLAYQAGHDSLTKMANRKTLHDEFPYHLERAKQSGCLLVVMLLDLDRFKEINDTLGHHFGDLVLNQVGPRLKQQCTEEMATIARLGGDEFALTISSQQSLDELTEMAGNIVEALRKPFDAGGINVTVGASLGMAIYPQHGNTSHDLLRAADVAMYEAKRKSAGVIIYDEVIDAYSATRLQVASDLNHAIANRDLVLHYQPKINVASGAVTGLEALVRWQHPQRGLLFPDQFIDLVEMSEIVHPFTKQVIEKAVEDSTKLRAMGITCPVAVNLSARNLINDSYLKWIEDELARHDLDTSTIEIELTESAVMQEPEVAIRLLERAARQGIKIAIDDFGTGQSSLSYLRNLPVSTVKVDKSFVINMVDDKQYLSIVKTTIILARELELTVIAEGVETDEALAILAELKCDEAQGYGICRPQPLEDIVDWMKNRPPQDVH